MQGVDTMNLSSAISHFLNCYLGSFNNLTPHVATEEKPKKKNRRKNKGIFALIGGRDSLDSACEKYDIQKVSLLRSFCKCVGIQLLLREYVLDSKNKQAFHSEDVLNVFPIVKHIHPKATDAYHVFTSGQAKIQQGLLQEGYELVVEALNLLNNVYGAMHYEIASCARLLARLSYIMVDYGEALVYQQRAVLMSERVLGIDHPSTITEYAHLALYCFANNQIPIALKLMYRALYLALLCTGENHPEIALFYCNIGLMVQAESDFDLSLKYLTKALELNSKFFGPKSLKCALNYHLIARTYLCKGDFRSALHSEKESYSIYKLLLGESHERTHESSECLKHLTNQAVKFQKTVNMLQKGEKITNMPSLQVCYNRPEDIEKFRDEMLKQQIVQKLRSSSEVAATTTTTDNNNNNNNDNKKKKMNDNNNNNNDNNKGNNSDNNNNGLDVKEHEKPIGSAVKNTSLAEAIPLD
ncbi:hypothetical protein HELRODRAFT_194531 [Helobdella robusta]|uniref:CLU central domain-containing protein n=1 Tax=Helobdella robusta TaxID=6412 RepID=T1FW58_HELRO|nr:hypothetical protein HELRODRAFT_194531 [Helobdella robusta]ESN91217.1 hypothetical protein HELRODRAFT_194531 [Helobdella robusta]